MQIRWYLFALAAAAPAQQPAVEHKIYRTPSPIVIDGKLDDRAWRAAPAVSDFVFNWHTSGEKEPTTAKLLWDDGNLYVSWQCKDRHISAYVTERHGPVSKDDCVEIFVSPNPAKVKNYYTFEINAIGTMLNRCRTDWWTGPPTWEPEGMRYRTSFHGLEKKDESPDDREWVVEAAIPLRNFARDAAHMPPREGDEWRLNLQRLGGKTNPQSSTWSPIPAPARSFHTPEAFGKVIFVSQAASRATATRAAAKPEDVAAGRALYNRSCTNCHGLDGAAGDRAPALGSQRTYLRRTSEDLFDAIKNGIKGTGMPGSPLPEGDVTKIIAYIRSLRATARDVAVAGDVARGEEVFRTKGQCTQCHMIRGRGGLLGPDLTNIAAERKVEDLKAALTVPRPHPGRGYVPVTIAMKDGARIKGVVKNEHNTSLQVLGEDGRLHLVNRDEAKSVEYSAKSMMPADYGKRLAGDELQNLLAYLSRQTREGR